MDDSGAVPVISSGATGSFGTSTIDLEGSIRSQSELISRYREIALVPEAERAVDDITNEAIVHEEDTPIVEIITDNIQGYSPKVLQAIQIEFEGALKLLDFKTKAYDIFRRWYIDGRLCYHAIIDNEQPQAGITELRYVDPRKIVKIREIIRTRAPGESSPSLTKLVKEYFLFSEKGFQNTTVGAPSPNVSTAGLRIAKDSIIYTTSGLTDSNASMVLGWLHKAIRAVNLLRVMEDAIVIYRISRSPERRIFYIDVGDLPKMKAEQYIKDLMIKFKNRLIYDSTTGEVKDDRKFMTIMEDFWLPTRRNGQGTRIETLPGGQNLSQIEDVQYFRQRLYRALNVPVGRLDPEAAFNLGHATEISRDEVNFVKFIHRLQERFSKLFLEIVKRQLLLKMVINSDDWDIIESQLSFKYAKDNYFSELKDLQIIGERMGVLSAVDQFVGKYFSLSWVKKNILRQSPEEMQEILQEIENEIPLLQQAMALSAGGMLQAPPEPPGDREEKPKKSK